MCVGGAVVPSYTAQEVAGLGKTPISSINFYCRSDMCDYSEK